MDVSDIGGTAQEVGNSRCWEGPHGEWEDVAGGIKPSWTPEGKKLLGCGRTGLVPRIDMVE